MKFSERVVLGSTLIKFDSLVYLAEGCGCLIGMAGAASGETNLQNGNKIQAKFPWLFEVRKADCPCCSARHYSYASSISCMAFHLEVGYATFEQALTYIRSIEPQDEVDPPDIIVPVWNRYHGVKA
jgi:hypothetical protein